MSIDPELQVKTDALEDERLKAEIIEVLTGPGRKRASDEAIYETMVSGYVMATEQQARLRKWRDDEVVAFSTYFKEKSRKTTLSSCDKNAISTRLNPGLPGESANS